MGENGKLLFVDRELSAAFESDALQSAIEKYACNGRLHILADR